MTESPIDLLLIEDTPSDVALTLHAFRKHRLADHVQVLRDGAEALEFIFCTGAYAERDMTDMPKVILLDLKLPLVSGLEVLRQIRADSRTQCIPVVMLTSSREDRDILESYQLGANSYIVKPVDFEPFSDAMRMIGTYWLLLNQLPLRPVAPDTQH